MATPSTVLNKILHRATIRDHYSRNKAACPHCGSDKLFLVRKTFHGDNKYKCTACGKYHELNVND